MPTRYVHTNIIAKDWERLAHFYHAVFDCIPISPGRDESGLWLERGTGVQGARLRGIHLRLPGCGGQGPTLEIFAYDEMLEKPSSAANRQGLGHLAFRVDDVAAIHQSVLAHGGADLGEIVTTEIQGVGVLTFVYMADPEGNIIEIQNVA
jgi:glyoxylase I family protein